MLTYGSHQPRQNGHHTISAPLSHFQVREIKLLELYALSQAGAWGNVEKPKHDMIFLLIAPDKTVEGKRVFGLVAVWMHLHQACHHSLGEAAHKLTPLFNIGTNWVLPLHNLMKACCTYPCPVRDT